MKGLFSFLMAAVLVISVVGCGDRIEARQPLGKDKAATTQLAGQLSEVAPPSVIQQLSQSLEVNQPQVTIISPKTDDVIQDTTVAVKFQVQDLPIFKDPDLGLGPHLHVILDNQPYKAVYDLEQPLVFEDLEPGTHTLRVFASRPWHESFKNEGAYAQTTFHVFTKTTSNNPDSALPLLTYSRPTGSYGAEPIMLDFYLTNAPLHLVAQENPEDEIADWRIRVTINGESFVLDRWQPIYLKGFKPGKNWVQLEFLDEQGNSVKNVFNDTVRLINYEPKGKDTLSKLVRGELSVEAARGIVDPNYKNQPTPPPTPAPEETPAVSPSATETPTPTPSVTPTTEATPTPEPEVEQSPESAPTPDQQTKKPKSGFFGLFRRPTESPSPSPEPTVPEEPEQTLEPEASPTPTESPTLKEEPTPATEVAPTPAISPVPIPIEPEKPRFGGFFNRFRRPEPIPSGSPNLPETLETPASAPTVPEEPEQTPESEALPTPTESPAFKEESTPATEVAPTPAISPVPIPIEPEKPGFGGFFNRFRRPVPTPSLSPKLPEELETPSSKPTVPGLPETKVETPAPEASDIPSNLRTPVEEPTPILKSVTPKAESSPVIKSVPNQPEKPKADDLQKLIQPPTIEEAAPESGLPPTLPEIIESPLRQSSGAETTPIPKSLTEKEQAASSEPPETAEAESAPAKPKLDLKEVLLSPPSPAPSPRIIQAPANPQSDIPARFLKKSVTDDSTNEPESSEAPTAN